MIVHRETKRIDIALLASTLFVSIPLVPLIASWSYAEAPFWVMTISSFGCLLLWRNNGKRFHLVWAAFLAAAAAYTKNEGILFCVIAAAWIITVPGHRLKSLSLFLIVFAVCYGPWYYWIRVVSDLGSHATTGLSLSTAAVLRAMGRFSNAFEMIVDLYSDIRQWNLVLWGAGIGWLAVFWRKSQNYADVLFPIFLLLGYLVIILFHQAEIYWQVGTSWNRLTVQVIPLLIVVVVPKIWETYFVD